MPNTAILCGALLVLIGLVGYGVSYSNGSASVTALIPTFLGGAIVILGMVARAKETLRMHLMHGAVLLGLLGFISTAVMLGRKLGNLAATPSVVAQIAMCLVCLAFVILSIRSFVAARRNRQV